jgi:hemerythrin-like metal-binding protein
VQGPEEYPVIGIAELDEEHRLLAAALRDLIAAVREDDAGRCGTLAHALLERATAHFQHEERLMGEVHFAFRARHQLAHELFLEQARQHLEEMLADGLSRSSLQWISETLEWFRSHVVKEDIAMARAIRTVRAGPG